MVYYVGKIDGNPTTILLTPEHRPDVKSEIERIRDVGGHIFRDRVMGILAITRAIGDIGLKKKGVIGISHYPDVTSLKLDKSYSFLVLCSDGVTDVINPKQIIEACNYAYEKYKKSSNSSHIARKMAKYLVQLAKKRYSQDNITAMVIIL